MKKLVIVAGLALFMVPVLAKDPNFSLKNKSGRNIVVKVRASNFDPTLDPTMATLFPFVIKNDKNKQLAQGYNPLDTSRMLEPGESFGLTLYDEPETPQLASSASFYSMDISYKNGMQQDEKLAVNFGLRDGSTYYVKFQMKNGKASLAPQEGRFFKTTEGYSLSKNVRLEKDKKSLVD